MNAKRIFGVILTILGIFFLIYCAVVFSKSTGNDEDIKSLIVFGVPGLLFYFAGLGLIRTTKDES